MLSGPATLSAPSVSTATSTGSPTSPSRPSRLRRLSYLRSYTGWVSSDHQPSTVDASSASPETAPAQPKRSTRTRQTHSPDHILAHPSIITPSLASEAPVGGWLPTSVSPDLDNSEHPHQASSARSRRQRDDTMTRHRSINTTASPLLSSVPQVESRTNGSVQSNSSRSRHSSLRITNPTPAEAVQPQLPISQLPSIRFVPYNDPRSARPSLAFPTITRTLPTNASAIRVGRYSEKDSAPLDLGSNAVSDAPVGFKSKVVSRRHCEFFYMDNQWHIRDVKSSSGTFLNHIRLSPPGEESKPFAIKDGDLVQLGIDFKGGEEMIFRCVKIRILCNRGWQKSVNKFNKSAHKQLNDLARGSGKEFKESTECTICLNSIAPCQSLFVAPCSHTWHYKCIRPMLEESNRSSTSFAQFLCPNCRSITDLNADVDEGPQWEDDFSDHEGVQEIDQSQPGTNVQPDTRTSLPSPPDDVLSADLESLSLRDGFQHPSFGLPPAGTGASLSRRSSSRGLNPSASSFVPTSSSALPLPPTPVLPHAALDSGPAQIPSLGFEPSISTARSITPHPSRTPRSTSAASANRVGANFPSALSTRHTAPYENEMISSPESEHDEDDDPGFSPVDQTATINQAGPLRYTSLQRSNLEALTVSPVETNGGENADPEGPMTPRNNAGPFVFDGAASPTASDGSNLRSAGADSEPMSLNGAAAT